MNELILIGAGGAGLEALLVAQRCGGWSVTGFADDNPALRGQAIEGIPVLGGIDEVMANHRGAWFHCAIGRNALRKRVAETWEAKGFRPATLIDPSALVAASAQVGEGAYVAPMVFIGPCARVGRHVLVNVGASVGHHANCADFSQVCPGARISGHAHLALGGFVGSNGVLAPGVSVGEWSTIGASSFVAREVPPRVTAVGVPAKILAAPAPTV